jgi:hypothetical protein
MIKIIGFGLLLFFTTGCFLNATISDLANMNPSGDVNPLPSLTPAPVQEVIPDLIPNVVLNDVVLSSEFTSYPIVISNNKTFGVRVLEETVKGMYGLYRIPFDGTQAVKIKLPFSMSSDNLVGGVKFSADDTTIIFRSYYGSVGTLTQNLYSVKIDGSNFSCLSCPAVAGATISETSYDFTQDQQRVVFKMDVDTLAKPELYSNNLNGTNRVKLNTTLTGTGVIQYYAISPDGHSVAYSGNHTSSSGRKLYLVSTLGTDLVQLSQDGLPGHQGVNQPIFSPDGTKIGYIQDRDTNGIEELHIVNTDGSNQIKLSLPSIANGDVTKFRFSPDGTRIVYSADIETDAKYEIYSVTIDGISTAKLNLAMGADRDASFVAFTPASDKVIYTSDQVTNDTWNMYIVDLDGNNRILLKSSVAVLNGAYQGYDAKPQFIDNDNFLYLADTVGDSTPELHKIKTDGTGAAMIYNASAGYELADISAVSFNSNKSKVVISARKTSINSYCKLETLNTDGTGLQTIFDCNTNNSTIPKMVAGLVNDKIYLEVSNNYLGANPLRSFALSLDGSAKTELLFRRPEFGSGFTLADDSKTLIMQKDLATGDYTDIHIFSQDIISGVVTQLTPVISDLSILKFFVSPDSSIVNILFDSPNGNPLYKANIDGSGWIKVTGADYTGFNFSLKYVPGTQRIVINAEQLGGSSKNEIYGFDYDGSNFTMLHPAQYDDIDIYKISPLGNKILYTGQQNANNLNEVFLSNLDGSGNIKLNEVLPVNGDVDYDEIGFTPNGNKVIYLAEQYIDGVMEAFAINLDGTSRQRLHPALTVGRSVSSFISTPNSQKIIMHGVLETAGVPELFSSNIDGSGFVKISGDLIPGGEVISKWQDGYSVSNDSQRVVFYAKKDDLQKTELYSVKLDGSGLVKLSPVLNFPEAKIESFAISSDSSKVLFISNYENKDKNQLYIVDIGGGNLKKLNRSVEPGDYVSSFKVAGTKAVYRLVRSDKAELYKINLDGTDHARLHSDLLPFQNTGIEYQISKDLSKIVYTINNGNLLKSSIFWSPL